MDSKVIDLVNKFGSANVGIIGDIMLDHYIWGEVTRISPEAPVPIYNVLHNHDYRLGGSGNTLHNVITLGGNISIFGVMGNGETGKQFHDLVANLIIRYSTIDDIGLVKAPNYKIPVKHRLLAMGQQVMRMDEEAADYVCTGVAQDEILSKLLAKAKLGKMKYLIVSDYHKGMITAKMIIELRRICREHGIKIVVNAKRQLERYKGVHGITFNKSEAEAQLGEHIIIDPDRMKQAGKKLIEALNTDFVLVTLGADGMFVYTDKEEFFYQQARSLGVYDVTGAGDTVLATIVLGLASGGNWDEVLYLANLSAGIAVSKVGTYAVTNGELLKRVYEDIHDGAVKDDKQG